MEKKLLLASLAALGIKLADDATDEAIDTEIRKLAAARDLEVEKQKLAAGEKEKLLKLAAGEKETSETLRKSLALETEARLALSADVEKLKLANRDAEITTLVDGLRRDRKIIAAEVDDVKKIALALGVPEAKRIYGARKPVLPAEGEIGHTPTATDMDQDVVGETPESASKKLDLAAAEFVKGGKSEADAFMLAIEKNPKLALAAQPAPTRVAFVAK